MTQDPAWMRIVDLFTRHKLVAPLTPLRDELVAHLVDHDDMEAIRALTADEGHTVTILCRNPDGLDAVEACGAWTGWKDRRFEGETPSRALAAAVAAMIAPAAPEPPHHQVERRGVKFPGVPVANKVELG